MLVSHATYTIHYLHLSHGTWWLHTLHIQFTIYTYHIVHDGYETVLAYTLTAGHFGIIALTQLHYIVNLTRTVWMHGGCTPFIMCWVALLSQLY